MREQKIKNIEELAIASENLLNEIYSDIKKLSEYSSYEARDKLKEVNKKIDLARTNGLNVDQIDNEILDFRLVLFNRDYNNTFDKIKNDTDKYEFDYTRLEDEYRDLLSESTVNHVELIHKMKELKFEAKRSKIKFMIRSLRDGELNSSFTFDRVAKEIAEAKELGIKVDDIEEMLFE